jgi:hypothetical protein
MRDFSRRQIDIVMIKDLRETKVTSVHTSLEAAANATIGDDLVV